MEKSTLEVGDTICQNGLDYIISKVEEDKIFKVSLLNQEESELHGKYIRTGYIITDY